jgi:release factor glutamine methyltransferase
MVQQLMQTPPADASAARLEAEILMAYCLDKPRSYLRAWPEKSVTDDVRHRLMQLLERRLNGEPIAYIIEQRDFWDITLKVTTATLIPRPETELLVEQSLKILKPHHTNRVADLGTGCGAVALCIAKHRPGCVVTAVDASAEALAVAKYNAGRLGLQNVDFIHGHWLNNVGGRRFHLIAANPPYIAENDVHLQLGDLRYEPRDALSAGPDGLRDLREIISTAPSYLLPGGWLLVEHGYDQGPAVKRLFQDCGFTQVQGYPDIENRDRVTKGQWNQ